MTPAAERYFDELRQLLRARKVPQATIDGRLSDLVATVAASGSHPYTEFGEPEALADRIAGESGGTASSASQALAMWAFAVAAVSLIADGSIGWVQDHAATFGIEPIFVVMIGVVFALLVVLPNVIGQRWPRYTGSWWSATAIVAAMLAIPATIQLIDRVS